MLRVVMALMMVAVPKSSLNFDTPRLNFLFSDRRVARSKLIILVETKFKILEFFWIFFILFYLFYFFLVF